MFSKDDIIINVENNFVKKTKIGSIGVCNIKEEDMNNLIQNYPNKIFLQTKYKQFLWLKNKKIYKI